MSDPIEPTIELSLAGSVRNQATGNRHTNRVIEFESYSFASDFITPCDAFTLTINQRAFLADSSLAELTAGRAVVLSLNLHDGTEPIQLCTGFLEQPSINYSRNGTFITLKGRDLLGPVCDSHVNPWSDDFKNIQSDSLENVITKTIFQFNIDTIYSTSVGDRGERAVGNGFGSQKKLTKKIVKVTKLVDLLTDHPQEVTTDETVTIYTDSTAPKDLTVLKTKDLKPKIGDTSYEFAERIAARFHLHIWARADGTGIVVGEPDYNQTHRFQLTNRADGQGNNIIQGNLEVDYLSQPSIIIAKGTQGGGDKANARMKVAYVNEFIGYTSPGNLKPSVQKILSSMKGLKPEPARNDLIKRYSGYFNAPDIPRVAFIEDRNSSTPEQLSGMVSRRMAEAQSKAIVIKYTVRGHAQNGVPYAFNTIATVYDDTLKVYEDFWISAVNYKGVRGPRGTTTELTLIPVGALVL